MRLLLVRHGQSEWNAARRLQGQADIGLSELGRAQADALRPVIQSIGPCRTVSSDLERVRETARRVGADAPRLTEGLREIDVGDWTGRAVDDIRAESEEAWLGWRAGTHSPPGGESWETFASRVEAAIEEERRDPCDNLLVTCHGGVIRAILQRYIGLDPARIIPVAPASLSAIRVAAGKPPRLELLNYLPDDLEFGAPD
ncbi:histidine phosphatase family protein [Jannaschia aquimarina]|uniref:CobC_1 protein n=1 Tax=Jannaschia aquimarina TaxID=935700 RepID=A0A0D1CTF2_9RHOB|nr:histidine phosphatase family protein [Jannaschia aquimarina]KIT18047.1 Alpha-ribazole phosphatase [Jannaschia aquimarina]SNS89236.1 probable phosphoglycerate mutase [Jannaschia aquimarina]